MALISCGTDALAGIIRVRVIHDSMPLLLALIVTAMLRDKSVFIDGGVQLYRQNETTWLGFSTPYVFKGHKHLTTCM
jgi:hypothetical protein